METNQIYYNDDDYFRSSASIKPSDDNLTKVTLQLDKIIIDNKEKVRSIIPFSSRNVFTKKDFEVIELLGKGAYAKVVKAININTKEIKAIKIVDKSFIEKENKLYQVYLENAILQMLNHPNIIKIEGIFEENEKIFIILEHLSEGDFFEFLRLNAPLKYETSKYYAAQIINALEYLHTKGISHRDLKPENLMLDKKFHIKIIDFATCKMQGKTFSKELMDFINEDDENNVNDEENEEDDFYEKKGHKNTFVGTAEYVSPEVLVDKEAGPSADLWALGCILFQMFVGYSPFRDKTEYLVFKKILELKFTFPENISVPDEAKDLIKSLLVSDPEKRLGSGSLGEENGYKALKNHPFFKDLDFDNLNELEPPYKNEFKKKIVHSKSSQNLNYASKSLEIESRHKNTFKILKQDVIEKKSPWFHYNTRKIVLDNTPKIEYIDPDKNIVKGVIYLTKSCRANYIDDKIFELFTPKRTFKFRTTQYESGVWSKLINETIEKYAKI